MIPNDLYGPLEANANYYAILHRRSDGDIQRLEQTRREQQDQPRHLDQGESRRDGLLHPCIFSVRQAK